MDLKKLFNTAYDRKVMVYDTYSNPGVFSPALDAIAKYEGLQLFNCDQVLFVVTSHPLFETYRSTYEPKLLDWYLERNKNYSLVKSKSELALIVFTNGEPLLGAY